MELIKKTLLLISTFVNHGEEIVSCLDFKELFMITTIKDKKNFHYIVYDNKLLKIDNTIRAWKFIKSKTRNNATTIDYKEVLK